MQEVNIFPFSNLSRLKRCSIERKLCNDNFVINFQFSLEHFLNISSTFRKLFLKIEGVKNCPKPYTFNSYEAFKGKLSEQFFKLFQSFHSSSKSIIFKDNNNHLNSCCIDPKSLYPSLRCFYNNLVSSNFT